MQKPTKKEVFYDTVLLIRINQDLKDALEIAAKNDRRNTSDWVRLTLEKAIKSANN